MKHFKLLIFSFFVLLLASCDNELDVNTDNLRLNIENLYLDVDETFNSKILPTNAVMFNSTWKSMDTTIAKVDQITGEVIGVSKGKTLISVVQNDGYFSGEYSVTVGYKRITLVEIYPIPDIELETTYFAETNVFENNPTETITWESLNSDIATINNETGEITPVSVGTVSIKAILVSNENLFDERSLTIINN
jgi:uncharacterized protein YjdB